MTDTDLLPCPDACPFCAGNAKHQTWSSFHHGDRGYSQKKEEIYCEGCGTKMTVIGDDITLEQAIERWNTRTPSDQYHLSSEEQGVMRNALRKSVKVIDPQSDMVAVPREVIDRVLSMLRECKSDYCHPYFTDRHGTGPKLIGTIEMLQPYTKGE